LGRVAELLAVWSAVPRGAAVWPNVAPRAGRSGAAAPPGALGERRGATSLRARHLVAAAQHLHAELGVAAAL